jgi:hypothetical protein
MDQSLQLPSCGREGEYQAWARSPGWLGDKVGEETGRSIQLTLADTLLLKNCPDTPSLRTGIQ